MSEKHHLYETSSQMPDQYGLNTRPQFDIDQFVDKIEQLHNVAKQRQYGFFTWHTSVKELTEELINMWKP